MPQRAFKVGPLDKESDMAMTKLDFSNPDEWKTPNPLTKVYTIWGDPEGKKKFHKFCLAPGWQWKQHVQPYVGGMSCQRHHSGYITAGSMAFKMDDGSETVVKAGQSYDIPPGHDAWNAGDDEIVCIEFDQAPL
mmetsp:Transcript_43531/g.103461  ORF Transcript_43531/g.103461 Transcript_43531/m.103461 type:complete len:134 (-) Transcript_43531:74-475(-)